MLKDFNRKMDESMFKVKASDSINAMLACLLNKENKICKSCNEVDVCAFLTEAVFAYRNKFIRKNLFTFDT